MPVRRSSPLRLRSFYNATLKKPSDTASGIGGSLRLFEIRSVHMECQQIVGLAEMRMADTADGRRQH